MTADRAARSERPSSSRPEITPFPVPTDGLQKLDLAEFSRMMLHCLVLHDFEPSTD